MKEVAMVESINANSAVVSVKRSTACGDSCATCSAHCNMKSNKITVSLNGFKVKPGDFVEIGISTKKVLLAAFFVYIMPLIIFFAGYLIVEYFYKSDVLALVCGVVAFAFIFILLHIWDKKHKSKISIVGLLED